MPIGFPFGAAAAGGNSFVGEDGPLNNWKKVSGDLIANLECACMDESTGDMYIAVPGGFNAIRRKFNGGSWQNIPPAAVAFQGVYYSEGVLLAANTTQIYRSVNQGDTWALVHTRDVNNLGAIQRVPGTAVFLVGDTGGGILVSANDGITWNRQTTGWAGFSASSSRSLFLGSRIVYPSGTNTFWSDDLGVTWTRNAAGVPSGSNSSFGVFFPATSQLVMRSGSAGPGANNRIWVSNNGTSFTLIDMFATFGFSPGRGLGCIYHAPTARLVLVNANNQVVTTTDFVNWTIARTLEAADATIAMTATQEYRSQPWTHPNGQIQVWGGDPNAYLTNLT